MGTRTCRLSAGTLLRTSMLHFANDLVTNTVRCPVLPMLWELHICYEHTHTRFLCRLCKIKYYNSCLFYNVQPNFLVQTGDPTNTGRGGESVYGVLYGEQARFFEDEIRPELKHKQRGVVGMASEWVGLEGGLGG